MRGKRLSREERKDKIYRYIEWDYGIDLYRWEAKWKEFKVWVAETIWIPEMALTVLLVLPLYGFSVFLFTWIYPEIMWFYHAFSLLGWWAAFTYLKTGELPLEDWIRQFHEKKEVSKRSVGLSVLALSGRWLSKE